MKSRNIIPFLAFGHGLNDLIAGYFLGTIVELNTGFLQTGLGLFLYNLIAFGGQYPVALLLERMERPGRSLPLAYGLNMSAVAIFPFIPQLSIILAGIASAIYHVSGGTICATDNKALNIGLFSAPGIAGLIAGGFLAYKRVDIFVALFVVTSLFFILLTRSSLNNYPAKKYNRPVADKSILLDKHDLIMILLLTVISLRSVIWNVFQLLHRNNYESLVMIAIAAVIGKIAGGWLADRIGWRLYIFLSLATAAPLLAFFKNEIFLFCIGVGLLQSGIPATTSLLIQSMNGKTEKAIGLSFGTAILFGAILFYTPFGNLLFSGISLFGVIVAMLGIMFFAGGIKSTA